MKNLNLKKMFSTIVFGAIFGINNLIGKNQPPAPKGGGGFEDPYPVGGAIDDYLFTLIALGLIIGIWGFYKQLKLSKEY